MKTRHRIAAVVRGLPRPFNPWLCAGLSRCGLLSAWNETFAKMGCPRAVLDGPFKGVRYAPLAFGSQLLPKLLGTYEMEISVHLLSFVARGPDVIVDIGSAEGYYAVGFAALLPDAKVVTFDTDAGANRQMLANARKNGMRGRFTSQAFCSREVLERVLQESVKPLVFSDCEGYEFELLQPEAVPSLRKAGLIIELHPDRDRAENEFIDRFTPTHRVEIVHSRPRASSDWPACLPDFGLPEAQRTAALRERSADQRWLIGEPLDW